jgi:hypothetical protein
MEMAEERIAERIDANLLNVNIQEIVDLPKQMFEKKVTNLAQKTQGNLIIKEYPTASAHAGHFKSLLNELALKKSFRPDIIFIDYLNICSSERYRGNSTVNSYSYIKAIAEELRGLAVEANVPIISATQTTRSGYGSSDVELTDTSESFGLPATADLMFALISTEELESLGQILVKQLKNRYNDYSVHRRFVVGIDRAKMRLYDCEQSAQDDLLDNGKEEEYNNEEQQKPKNFIYEVRDLDGNRYRHCGSQKDADKHVMRNPGFTWEKVYLSPPPKTVDVDSVTLPPDLQLPESQAQPLNL